ncbi:MAG TPA: hypothetical protein VK896_03535 [Gaiellaceae bacterium]|nr:hypothetical protein [Gaiellaceae bacterium]
MRRRVGAAGQPVAPLSPADRERPSALAVRGGLFGTRVEIAPGEEVAHVIPRSKLLSLRADERRAA